MPNSYRQSALVCFLLLAATGYPSSLSVAQTQQQIDWCAGKGDPTPDLQISACTAVIQSGNYSEKNLAFAFNTRADAFYRKKALDKAIADYSEAIKLFPEYFSALNNRGHAYLAQKQYLRAAADFGKLVQLYPKKADGYHGLCGVFIEQEQLQEALSNCNDAIRAEPNSAGTLFQRGIIYLKTAQLDRAISDFDASLKLYPKGAGAMYARGLAKLRKGNVAGSQVDIAMAKSMQSNVKEELASDYRIE
jgi:tetratricopeptide (TPR) repeat protein